MDGKDIANTIYHSAVTTFFVVCYSMAIKKLIKFDIKDPTKADINEIAKLTGVVTMATITKDYLVKNKIIPEDIIKT